MSIAAMTRTPPTLRETLILAGLGWIALNAAILALSGGVLPFERPNLAGAPFGLQLAMPSIALVEQLALMGMVAWMTRRRPAAETASRAPDAATSRREVAGMLLYAGLAQAGGWVVGPALGYRPFSFHLAGTLVGCTLTPTPGEAAVWAGYNFLAFALAPYLWFRRRYSHHELWLTFDGKGRDLRVLLAVLAVEGSVQLAVLPGVLALPLPVLVRAAPLAFALFGIGTVLPTMVTVYAILLPRYLRITGSAPLSVVLGGLTYAGMHLVEGWSTFRTPSEGLLSVLFVILSYTGPGMFKSFVTLRTGNAWVHALGYHAVAPHTIADTPLIAKVFGIR